MPRNQTTARLRLCCAVSLMTFALAGCDQWATMLATRPPAQLVKLQVERPQINQSSLLCPPRPLPPEGGTQADVAVYLRTLEAWGRDCEAKLADVREILRPTQEVTP